MKFLLSVIAVCLVMITAKLYIPEAQAEPLTGYETSLVLDAVERRCRVDDGEVKKMINDKGNYRPFYNLPISC
mgnify:CR=1 FL=1